jgi:hypothetical protein
VRFRGLLVPDNSRMSGQEYLVAVWRTTRGQRFQNYRGTFTVLDELRVSRAWINQIVPATLWVESAQRSGGPR